MKEFSSCKLAIQSCLETKSFAVAHLYNDDKPMDMHIHDCYEIYYSISGGKQFLIDNRFYDIQPGDIFFINQYESHYLSQLDRAVHERFVLEIHPDFLTSLSSEQTDLNLCFHFRSDELSHKLHLTEEEQNRFRYFVHKLAGLSGYGSDLEDRAVFTELMVFLNRIFYQRTESRREEEEVPSYHTQVDEILSFINQNISSPLSIEDLSGHFFLSSSYLCRIFKAATGTTINKYITAKRITVAKSLLSSGYSVTETCERCGFNDYSNFLKAFTKAVGISPKKYAQCSAS
ncbi:MAG TPA: AraC family transcriptional regulator [Candidatus Eisenbergiella pullistercoris]|uniref:AraC family transcriptional regulator n=1 Tax=Candidatus Eisenbergiella pullistercoris TaxID=2838555 RepID=A0A9D1YQ55_9FIRM|nr:AraC family transcriptional regulator [Candidatus Eisenbergiella pullistercoris]